MHTYTHIQDDDDSDNSGSGDDDADNWDDEKMFAIDELIGQGTLTHVHACVCMYVCMYVCMARLITGTTRRCLP